MRRAVCRHLSSALKVFVADCDHTLWEGVASEDGPEGVRLTAGHLALQSALSKLQRSGRLVCLASRNDEADVLGVFQARAAEMPLQPGPH